MAAIVSGTAPGAEYVSVCVNDIQRQNGTTKLTEVVRRSCATDGSWECALPGGAYVIRWLDKHGESSVAILCPSSGSFNAEDIAVTGAAGGDTSFNGGIEY